MGCPPLSTTAANHPDAAAAFAQKRKEWDARKAEADRQRQESARKLTRGEGSRWGPRRTVAGKWRWFSRFASRIQFPLSFHSVVVDCEEWSTPKYAVNSSRISIGR